MTDAETYRSIHERGGIADLTGRLVLRLTGEDRVRYLNGQVSNDVRTLEARTTLHACVMTAKGRMSGDVYVVDGGEFLQIDAESSLRDTLPARLERYIIADDVVLEDVTETTGLLHIVKGDADTLQIPGIRCARSNRFGMPGLDLWGDRSTIVARFRELADALPVVGPDILESLRIEAGIPKWGAELDEDTIPIEAGLQRDAISYEKGCYIGQEVVSRLKSIGHVNRTLRGLVSTEAAPRAGWNLFDPENPGREVGSITSVAYSFALERPAALGYVKRGVENPELVARAGGGQGTCRLQVRDLPLIP